MKSTNSEKVINHNQNIVNPSTHRNNNAFTRSTSKRYSEERKAGGRACLNGHISPQSPLTLYNKHQKDSLDGAINIWTEGQFINVSTPWMHKHTVRKQAKRGKIKGYTAKSRKRFLEMMAKTDQKELPIFITLTYPKIFPEAKDTKKHLDNFIKRMRRRHGIGIGYVWKLEKQKRGAPHYHLFMWGLNRKELFMNISQDWYEIVGSGDPKHLAAGTKYEQILNRNGLMKYASKYLAKIDKEFDEEEMGRIWGKGGNIPFSKECSHTLTREQAIKFNRLLRRATKQDNPSIRHYFIKNTKFWEDRYQDIIKAS